MSQTTSEFDSPFVELHHGLDLSPVEIAALTAANSSTDPEHSWRESLLSYRMYALRKLRDELLNKTVVDDSVIRRAADTVWQLYIPVFRKATGPMIAEAYIRAFRSVEQGDVPVQLIYALANEHADRVGKYFNDTSTDALIQGFNTYVNRQVPQRAAMERVIDAYGLTPRQMSGLTSAEALNPTKKSTAVPQAAQKKIKSYIGKSIADRINIFKRQEAHNLDEQAKQVAWLWLVENGKLPKTAQKMWLTASDEKVCGQCGPMHRKKVDVGEKFELPNGNQLFVPGAHVNCRCEVRLQINPFTEVGKSFDPDEHPRDKSGRWTSGISESDKDEYTNNRCADLALSLHEKTGWPIHVITDYENDVEGWIHAGVMTPKGTFLDVHGEHDIGDLMTEWSDYWGSISDVDFADLKDLNWPEGSSPLDGYEPTKKSDRIADILLKDQDISKADFEEKEHPRGSGGRFVRKPREPEVAEREVPSPELEEAVRQARELAERERIRRIEETPIAPVRPQLSIEEAPPVTRPKLSIEGPPPAERPKLGIEPETAPPPTAPVRPKLSIEAPVEEAPVRPRLGLPVTPRPKLTITKPELVMDWSQLVELEDERQTAQQRETLHPELLRPTRQITAPDGTPTTAYLVTGGLGSTNISHWRNSVMLTDEDELRVVPTAEREDWTQREIRDRYDAAITAYHQSIMRGSDTFVLIDHYPLTEEEMEGEEYPEEYKVVAADVDSATVFEALRRLSLGDESLLLENIPQGGIDLVDDEGEVVGEIDTYQHLVELADWDAEEFEVVLVGLPEGYSDATRKDEQTWLAPGTYTVVNDRKMIHDIDGRTIPFRVMRAVPVVREEFRYTSRGLRPESPDFPPS